MTDRNTLETYNQQLMDNERKSNSKRKRGRKIIAVEDNIFIEQR